MTTVTTNFTYTLPNEPKVSDFSNNVTVNATYNGPKHILVVVDETTNLVAPYGAISAELEETFAAPAGHKVIKVDCEANPILGSLLQPETVTINDPETEITEELPEGNVYSYTWPQFITIAYVTGLTKYNSDSGTWTYTHYTEEDNQESVSNERNALLNASDGRIAPDMPDSLKQKWIDYRQKLRDLPATWAGVKSWKVIFPKTPDEV
jgi:hypothetical protein